MNFRITSEVRKGRKPKSMEIVGLYYDRGVFYWVLKVQKESKSYMYYRLGQSRMQQASVFGFHYPYSIGVFWQSKTFAKKDIDSCSYKEVVSVAPDRKR